MRGITLSIMLDKKVVVRDRSFSAYTKFSENLRNVSFSKKFAYV